MTTKLVAVLDLNTGEFNTKLDGAEQRVVKSSGRMGKVMADAGKAGVGAMLAFTAGSVKAASEFEKNMTEVGTLFGDKGDEMAAKFGAAIMKLDPRLGKTEGLIKGLYQTISNGISEPVAAMKTLEDASKLAIAGVGDQRSAVDLVTKTFNAYGKMGENSTRIADMAFTTVKLASTTLPELAQSFTRVTDLASNLHVPLAEALGAFAEISSTFPNSAETVTGLKQALVAINKPTKDAASEAEALGLNFGPKAIEQAGGFVKFIEDVAQKTAGKDGSVAKLFGGVEGMNAVTALIARLDGFKAKSAENAAAATSDGKVVETAFEQMSKTGAAKIDAMWASFEKIQIALGNEFLPQVADAAKQIADNIDIVKNALNFLLTPVRLLAGLGKDIGTTAGNVVAIGQAFKDKGVSGAMDVGHQVAQGEVSKYEQRGVLGNALGAAIPGGNLIGKALNLPGFAEGTSSAPGGAALVGEKGPEIVNLPKGSQVLPNSAGIGGSAYAGGAGADIGSKVRAFWAKAAQEGSAEGLKKGGKEGAGGAKGEAGTLYDSLFKASAKSGMKGIMGGIMSGDVGDSIKDFAKNLANTAKTFLKDALMQALGKKIFKSLFGGGFGGFMEDGGSVRPRTPYIVGEKRPELFVPDVAGRIIPSVPNMQPHVTVSIGEVHLGRSAGASPAASALELAKQLARIIRDNRVRELNNAIAGAA